MRKYLNQVHSFKKLASWTRNVLILLDWQILMTRRRYSLLPKMQDCEMKICTVPVHVFFRAKDRLSHAKTWRDVLHSRENFQKECLDVVTLLQKFACFDIARPDLKVENYVHADATFRLGSFPRNTVTRSSVSCHAEKIQRSNKLTLIDFHRESKVEYLNFSLLKT